jgi:hypothetical protein
MRSKRERVKSGDVKNPKKYQLPFHTWIVEKIQDWKQKRKLKKKLKELRKRDPFIYK